MKAILATDCFPSFPSHNNQVHNRMSGSSIFSCKNAWTSFCPIPADVKPSTKQEVNDQWLNFWVNFEHSQATWSSIPPLQSRCLFTNHGIHGWDILEAHLRWCGVQVVPNSMSNGLGNGIKQKLSFCRQLHLGLKLDLIPLQETHARPILRNST